MALPEKVNLSLYRGDDYLATLRFRNADGTPFAVPTTGWSAQIRKGANETGVLASFTIDATQGATGLIVISLTGAQAQALQNGVWDLQNTQPGSGTRTYMSGRVKVLEDVTRP